MELTEALELEDYVEFFGTKSWSFDMNTVLGEGRFATVYLGTYDSTQVAIKRFNNQSSLRQEQEIQKLTRLEEYEHIQRVLHVSMNLKGKLDLVLELGRGGTLDEVLGYINNRDKEWKRTVVLQIACGIEYLHINDILHGDIKPTNIVFRDKTQTRLMVGDFGLPDNFITTPEEFPIFKPSDKIYTRHSDIYSMAVVSCCVFENVYPQTRHDLRITLRNVKDTFDLHYDWVMAITNALNTYPTSRPSAEEFRVALQSVVPRQPRELQQLVGQSYSIVLIAVSLVVLSGLLYFITELSREYMKQSPDMTGYVDDESRQ